jgi:regulator of nucleoside diphosphate kinase
MKNAARIRISASDHQRLLALLDALPLDHALDTSGLEDELARADVVPAAKLPKDVVTMDSLVDYVDLETGRSMRVQITYPDAADVEQGKISVLAPVGAALIGLKVGQTIDWPLPDGRTGRLQVKRVAQAVDSEPPPRSRVRRPSAYREGLEKLRGDRIRDVPSHAS